MQIKENIKYFMFFYSTVDCSVDLLLAFREAIDQLYEQTNKTTPPYFALLHQTFNGRAHTVIKF